eukprot:Selendium_serpulae@DN6441_c0_g1_i6.p2
MSQHTILRSFFFPRTLRCHSTPRQQLIEYGHLAPFIGKWGSQHRFGAEAHSIDSQPRPITLPSAPLLPIANPVASRDPLNPETRGDTVRHFLTDRFGRVHDYLRISLTEKCNLRCQYCMPTEGVQLSPPENLLTSEEIVRVASVLVRYGVRKIRLTGGEPTVRRDFQDVLLALSRSMPRPIELGLTTNGVTLDRHLDALRRANVFAVNVSLDTLDPHEYFLLTKRNAFDKVMRNIERLVAADFCKVKLNVVVMRGVNDREIEDFVELTRMMPLQVRFIEFMPFKGNKWARERFVGKAELLERIARGRTVTQVAPEEAVPDRIHCVNL